MYDEGYFKNIKKKNFYKTYLIIKDYDLFLEYIFEVIFVGFIFVS